MAPLIRPASANVRPRAFHFSREYLQRTLSDDRQIIDRLIAAYHHATQTATPQMQRSMVGPIWGEGGLIGKQAALIRALQDRSAAAVHEILRSYFITDAAFGIAMGSRDYECVCQPGDRAYHGLMWLDRLVGLAHAVGAVPVPNPEDCPERWERCLEADVDEVIVAIEATLGLRLEFPNICAVFGGEIRGQAFPLIAFTHLLVALTLRDLASADHAGIVEIGGGFGGLAYFATRLVPAAYSVFDLPWANAVQAYFLDRALPGVPLALSGEPRPRGNGVTLLPAWALLTLPADTSVDVMVNQDSMPEMPQEIARCYLRAARAFLRGPFLSVNQEPPPDSAARWGRASVASLVGDVGGFARRSRTPFPLRLGYVQEIYYPADRPLPSSAFQSLRTALRLLKRRDVRGLKDRFRRRVGQLFRQSAIAR